MASDPDRAKLDLIVHCADGGGWSVSPGRSGGEERVDSLSGLVAQIRRS